MVKRTLFFSSPAYLSCTHQQLVVSPKDNEAEQRTIPIEDIGVVVLEHPQITITSRLLSALLEAKVALISCDQKFMPAGMFLSFEGNSELSERFQLQIESSVPLKKQLWQQTVRAKIDNQARVLEALRQDSARLYALRDKVLSGDSSNCEAMAAKYYWGKIYGQHFTRTRDADTPNAQLNYAYAILRSVVARAIVSTGLLPALGIFHRNKYNAFCLADDLMEPYRPLVDWTVLHLEGIEEQAEEGLTREQKVALLRLPTMDVQIEGKKKPLFHAVSTTTASLYKCLAGDARKVAYPQFEP